MSDTLVAPKYTLTPEDLKVIAEVCEETAKSGSPIAVIRGPETQALLRKWFPKNDGWAKLQKIGTIRTTNRGPEAGVGRNRPSQQFHKRVEYRYVCERWPNGIPIGVSDVHTQRRQDDDEYKLTSSTDDITWDQDQRLLFMSKGLRKPTDAEIRADAARKEAMRNKRYEAENFSTPMEQAVSALVPALKEAFRQASPEEPAKKAPR